MQARKLQDYNIKKQILETVKKWDKIIVHRHVRPDPDAVGSQTGLAELIKTSFPDKKVLTAGENPGDLDFMAVPDQLSEEDYKGALVIVTDTANTARIDGENYQLAEDFIKIDHHPLDDSYGTVEWVNTQASSCSEMIADFWLTFQDELVLSDNGARLLYGGIVGDTGRFQYDNTTSYTMEVASKLMEFDFRHTDFLNQLNTIKPEVAALMGYALENVKVSEEGVGHLILDRDILAYLKLEDSDTSKVVGLPGSIEGVEAWGIFVEQKDGSYRCRLRSKGPVINGIAKEHDGGGHPLASGANAKDLDEIQEILEKFTKVTIEWKNMN